MSGGFLWYHADGGGFPHIGQPPAPAAGASLFEVISGLAI